MIMFYLKLNFIILSLFLECYTKFEQLKKPLWKKKIKKKPPSIMPNLL